MTRITRRAALAGGLLSLAGCGAQQLRYSGPAVTQVVVDKSRRRMALLHGDDVIKRYRVQLGFTAKGPKRFEGDGRTPEGLYHVDRRNPNSAFYLSIGIDYPNAQDRAFAAAMGRSAGGDIFVHGWGEEYRGRRKDWTAGCIAVTNPEMREVYAMVRDGTPILIHP
jgi:murein L,D-transpeptidase YafK